MSKAPAFQLYASDFDMDTASWDNEEVGIYFRLLMYQWVNKSIPKDTKRLAKIVRMGHKKFQNRWQILKKKFIEKDLNNLVNEKMEKVRVEQIRYRETQSKHGRKGVVAKREKGIYPFDKLSDPSSDPASDPARVDQALRTSTSLKDLSKDKSPTGDHFKDKMGEFLELVLEEIKTINKYPQNGKPLPQKTLFQWTQEKANIRGHPKAIYKSLNWLKTCLKNGEAIDSFRAFVEKTFATVNPKYDSRDAEAESDAFKQAVVTDGRIKQLIGGIGK